ELKQIGNITPNPKRDNPQTNRVYDKEGLSPTLSCMEGGNLQPMIVVSRGRNKDNPSDRTAGVEVEQRLDPNSQGICNTLTSVQKDNLVLEPAILTPKRTEYGKAIRKDYENGKIQESRHNMTELQPREDGMCNTLTTVQKDNYLLEPTVKIKQATKGGYIECKVGGVADLSYPTSKTRRGRVQDNGDTSPTITATETGIHKIESLYRIRKLTPLECWRLMGFTDDDYYKAEEVNSNTQLYKQAGNSIVVDVLEGIFKQML
ncbi:MAG TPA: DNA cytosine methyltransferase, partial [Tissierellaceae bacterium]|nr:DNA cytosine methyltransferase [Tissierellaceae bacterium]